MKPSVKSGGFSFCLYTEYVTNGRLIGDAFGDVVWTQRPVRLKNAPDLFTLIESGVRKREAKGVDLRYLSSAEMEEIRWKQDPYHRHFQAHDPFAAPKVRGSGRDPHAAAEYQCMRERSTLTQRLNTVKYAYGDRTDVI